MCSEYYMEVLSCFPCLNIYTLYIQVSLNGKSTRFLDTGNIGLLEADSNHGLLEADTYHRPGQRVQPIYRCLVKLLYMSNMNKIYFFRCILTRAASDKHTQNTFCRSTSKYIGENRFSDMAQLQPKVLIGDRNTN